MFKWIMKFLIQTIDGKVRHDFALTLLESIDYQHWLRNHKWIDTVFTDSVDLPKMPNCIPIGSVEFVSKYLWDWYGLIPKPKNIPSELLDKRWTGRNVFNGTELDIVNTCFIKSNDKIKSFAELNDTAPKGNYQISELIDIQSEWRGFVYEGELVGLQNYAGGFDIFPNVKRIKEMITAYTSQPIAYTLDVAISNGETVIIEVHDFFSCGLYGFADLKRLPFMFSKWFFNFILNEKRND